MAVAAAARARARCRALTLRPATALRLGRAEDFVAAVTEGQPPQPGYFGGYQAWLAA